MGDGGTTKGIDENNTMISYNGLVDIHMKPYIKAIARGVSTIMVSYSSWNGVKMHANRFLLTDVLKGQLGFKGFVISDWQGLDKITDPVGANYSYSVLTGIHAGIDMVMVPYTYKSFHDLLKRDVMDGTIPMSRIDDAVSRILQVKFQAGLFEKPYADKTLKSTIGSTVSMQHNSSSTLLVSLVNIDYTISTRVVITDVMVHHGINQHLDFDSHQD